jgi:peptidoglycan/LPS O-acetylase OafA/YrhL
MSAVLDHAQPITRAAPPFAAPGLYPKSSRFTYIDALRGLAALAVAAYHFYHSTGLKGVFDESLPRLITAPLSRGYLGVQVFFVLSGFVIAFSQRDTFVTLRYLGNFALRRSLRLDPPYWVTIFAVILLNYVARRVGFGDLEPLPSWPVVLANMAYLHDLLGLQQIVAVSWTLCIEVQFYLMLTVLVGLVQRLPGQRALLGWPSAGAFVVFIVLFAASLLDLARPRMHWSLFLPHWYMFFLGAVVWWTLDGRVHRAWVWVCAAAVVVVMVMFEWGRGEVPWHYQYFDRSAVAVATALSILIVGTRGKLETLLSNRPLQFLGRISYSLYLAHAIAGGKVMKLGQKFVGTSPAAAVFLFFLAFGVSILGAYVFYRLIERPSVELTKRLKRKPKTLEPPTGFAGPVERELRADAPDADVAARGFADGNAGVLAKPQAADRS